MEATKLSVRRTIVVDAPQERAFATFVDMTAWWPLATHTLGEAPGRASIVEQREGGRWYAVDANGSEHGIGRVVAFEPPERLVLTWQVDHDFAYDQSLVTTIEVRFLAETDERTRIDLEHRGFDAYGGRAEEQRALYDSDGAWTYILGRFSAAFAASENRT